MRQRQLQRSTSGEDDETGAEKSYRAYQGTVQTVRLMKKGPCRAGSCRTKDAICSFGHRHEHRRTCS